MMRCDAAIAIITLAAFSCFAGCDGAASDTGPVARCQVLIDGQPAADVHVLLLSRDSPEPVLEGITDLLGMADLKVIADIDFEVSVEQEFRVAVESLGDWQIKKPWSDRQDSPLTGKYAPGDEPILIELPKKAIKHL